MAATVAPMSGLQSNAAQADEGLLLECSAAVDELKQDSSPLPQVAAADNEEEAEISESDDDGAVDESAVTMSTAVVESMITILRQNFLQKSALQTVSHVRAKV
jgi:hypothetical protein